MIMLQHMSSSHFGGQKISSPSPVSATTISPSPPLTSSTIGSPIQTISAPRPETTPSPDDCNGRSESPKENINHYDDHDNVHIGKIQYRHLNHHHQQQQRPIVIRRQSTTPISPQSSPPRHHHHHNHHQSIVLYNHLKQASRISPRSLTNRLIPSPPTVIGSGASESLDNKSPASLLHRSLSGLDMKSSESGTRASPEHLDMNSEHEIIERHHGLSHHQLHEHHHSRDLHGGTGSNNRSSSSGSSDNQRRSVITASDEDEEYTNINHKSYGPYADDSDYEVRRYEDDSKIPHDGDDDDERPLDLSLSTALGRRRGRTYSGGTDSDDSAGGLGEDKGQGRAYKKSLMKRYCKSNFLLLQI